MTKKPKTKDLKEEFLIESEIDTFEDICSEIMEAYKERESTYRTKVIDELIPFISKYEFPLIAAYILKNSKWQEKSYLDIMAGEGLTTSVFLNALLNFSENKGLTFDEKVGVIDSLVKEAESEESIIKLFQNVPQFNLTGVEANKAFAETSRKSGIYSKGVFEAVLPCERLGLPKEYPGFDYGWIFSQSLSHICGSDGDKVRQYLFEQIRGLINDRNPDARFFFDHISLENSFRDKRIDNNHNVSKRLDKEDQTNYTYVRLFSCDEIIKLAKNTGFEVERQEAISFPGASLIKPQTVFTSKGGYNSGFAFDKEISIVLNILKPI